MTTGELIDKKRCMLCLLPTQFKLVTLFASLKNVICKDSLLVCYATEYTNDLLNLFQLVFIIILKSTLFVVNLK